MMLLIFAYVVLIGTVSSTATAWELRPRTTLAIGVFWPVTLVVIVCTGIGLLARALWRNSWE